MSALDELKEKKESGEKLTSLEFAVWWCTDRVAAEEAASQLSYLVGQNKLFLESMNNLRERVVELENELSDEEQSRMNAQAELEEAEKRVEKLEAALKPFAEIPCLENFDDDQLYECQVEVGDVRKARTALKA